MSRFSTALFLVLASACAPSFEPLNPHPVVLKNYEIGETRSATVGEPIFRVQQAREVPTFVALRTQRVSGLGRPVQQGMRFVAIGKDSVGNFRLSNSAYDVDGWFIVGPDGTVVGFTPSNAIRPSRLTLDQPLFRRETDVGNQPGAFTAELIYSGLANNVVRAVYREYVDDLARPAFSQELQYDLAADRTIAYKSIRVRVIEATNSVIRYEVLEDGDLPWLPAPRELPVVARPE
jgi:hypothetical protein